MCDLCVVVAQDQVSDVAAPDGIPELLPLTNEGINNW